jgi:hypothetical protein
MRNLVAFAALLFLLPAAKPVPPGDAPAAGTPDAAGERWRGQGISVCVAELRAVPDLSPDDLEAICGCAFDRVLAGRGTAPLPPVEGGTLPPAMRGHLLLCTAQTRPDRTSQVARLNMRPPAAVAPVAEPLPAEAKPVDEAAGGPPADQESGGGFLDWVRSLSLPDWLTGASLLWWIAIGIFVFGLLILKLRRRDPRRDLTGPPSYMRRGAPPQPPRRPDLPR